METHKVRIDLAKETFNFSEISNLHEIEEIRFDNCTEKFEIPLTINEYSNITRLSFSGQSKDSLYETPDNLEQLIHIKHLTFWRYCDFTKLKPMTHIEELYITVKDVETDIKQTIILFPNLKKITVWGNFLKKQLLPEEIGNLNLLESINLVECGVSTIPDSIANLKQLKELKLRGLPLKSFPEVITQLENLEVLEIGSSLIKLPNGFSNLKKLKKLNLDNSLNRSATREDKYLKPIPEVIGKLKNLEELSLGSCKVFDITPITPLKNLKKLNLRFSTLKDCAGFSNFSQLEDLILATNYDLVDIEGLKGLPLKKLELTFNPIKSIEIITSLKSLETLDIQNCRYINDFNPVYNHPNIKELEAEFKILENWKKRLEIKELPSISTIITQLETEALSKFEEAISYLSKLVKANYSNKENPLAEYFNLKNEEEKIAKIEIFDNAIQKHLKNLSEKTLITIFKMTFKSVIHDNYNASLIVLEEIITRKNVETQKKIVEQFYDACKFYDAGHRLWSSTVYDQLIDDLFPQFTSEALFQLLKKASTDMLNTNGGDGMEVLFIPAFQNTTDDVLYKKFLKILYKYDEEARTYYGKEYFDTLLQQIIDIASPELEILISAKKEENKEQEALSELLENLNEANLPKAIGMLGNKIPKKMEDDFLYNINKACQKNEISEEAVRQLIIFLIKKKELYYLADLLKYKYHKTHPEKIIETLDQAITTKSLGKNEIYDIVRMIIIYLVPDEHVLFHDLEIYRNFIITKCDVLIDNVYDIEVQQLLTRYFDAKDKFSSGGPTYLLEKTKEIISKTEVQFSYKNLKYEISSLVHYGVNEKCRTVFNYLYPKIINYSDEDILYPNVIASIKLNDWTYFDTLLKEIQKLEEITQVLLAYNLSCGFAHFGRKEEMLFYSKESIRLGKTKQEFLDDKDFEKYWNDEDFLKTIEEE
ncbi:leucine-rich repeat domain-containing protein [Flavobacterium sp. HNIBRBA15423]|uniref:leucine-rich repeat domain-containing protein n=1 Tax=Flavobacterium sp. HNIBRBA15423 TaxID=3458683 RepID=UPI00404410BD